MVYVSSGSLITGSGPVAGPHSGRGSMSRTKMLVSAVGTTAVMASMSIVGTSGTAMASPSAGTMRLPGSAAPFISSAQATGTVAGSKQLTIQVWLRPQLASAQRYATEVSTPGSRSFHHYLSPNAYTARFGATSAEAAKVESWLRAGGFTGVATDAQRDFVRATAAAATIDKVLSVQLKLYRAAGRVNAGRYPLQANDRPVSIPASLSGDVLGVTGLDNAAPMVPFIRRGHAAAHAATRTAAAPTAACSHFYGQHQATGLPKHFGETSFPTEVCGYTPAQMRAVYGANNSATGKGQTIALVELGLTPDMFLTLQDYAKANGMPAPSSTRYAELSLGKDTCGDPFDIEEQLDVESSYDMAPGASQLVVGGDSCNNGNFGLQGLLNADIAVLNGSGNHPLASVASNSWEGFDEAQPASIGNVEDAYLVRSVAEGVGMYFSSGDASGVGTPSDDPFATAVGGTTLGIGKAGNRLFETGWSTGQYLLRSGAWRFDGEQGAAGGGPSLLWKQPSYQRGVVPKALATAPGNRSGRVRSIPDISADADPFTGFLEGALSFHKKKPPTYGQFDIGGTSLAAPLVAGIVTAAQQGRSTSFGFLNPVFYKLFGTSAITGTRPLTSSSPAPFRGTACDAATCGTQLLTDFDDQNPAMEGYTGQVTLNGYDNMTGVGTPNGQKFIAGLRKLAK